MVSTYLSTGEFSACSLSPTWFCLYGLALLAIWLSPIRGLATTLNLAVRCNTTIRPEFVRCTLVICELLSVCQLAITLNVVVCCNIAIRPESIHYVLEAFRQTSVCYSVTTLGLAVRCDTAIGLKFVHYVLTVFRLLPICSAFPMP